MTAVRAEQRFARGRRCPICDGADHDPRGTGKRCSGFISSEGKYAHCSREEHAGSLEIEEGGTYAHRLAGPCKCGATHGEASGGRVIEATYDYRDERGELLSQVVRFVGKDFRQRRPRGSEWDWKLGDVRLVLYRLPELLAADPTAIVYIVEGEKDVDNLRGRGFVATCNPMGAGKWHKVADCARTALRGRRVVVVPDQDAPGFAHAEQVMTSLKGIAASLRLLSLPSKDVSDWFAEGHTAAELEAKAAGLPEGYAVTDGPTYPTSANDGEVPDPWTAELAQARADIEAKLDTTTRGQRAPLFGTDAVDLLQTEFPAPQWQVTGLVTKGGTTVVAGEPKAAVKTWLMLEGSIAIATGTKMLGEFYAEAGTVAIFFAEDHKQSVRNRVRALCAGANRTLTRGRLHLQPRGEFIDVLKDEDLAWIIASARRLPKLDLLVLDPLRDIHSGEEDKSDSMRDVMRRLRMLGEILGCTVWVSHHVRKPSKDSKAARPGTNARGSSAIHGSVDSGLYVEPGDGNGTDVFVATVTSQVKAARSAGEFTVELEIDDDENGEAVCARWTYSRVDFKTGKDPAEADDDATHAWLVELAKRGEFLTETDLKKHPARPVVGKSRISERRVVAAIARLERTKRANRLMGRVHPDCISPAGNVEG